MNKNHMTRSLATGMAALVLAASAGTSVAAPAPQWQQGAPMSVPAARFDSIVDRNGNIYAIGGSNASDPGSPIPLKDTSKYNAKTNSWTSLAPMITPRRSSGALADENGFIYVTGGYSAQAAVGGGYNWFHLSSMEIYDPVNNKWTTGPRMSTERSGHTFIKGKDGRFYAIGGANQRLEPLASVDVYAPGSDRWIPGPAMPTARRYHASAMDADGRLYAFGGSTAISGSGGTKSAIRTDAASSSWEEVAPMPEERTHSQALKAPDGRIYLVGGQSASGQSTAILAYTPSANSWSQIPVVTPRDGAAYTMDDKGTIYITGGWLNGTHSNLAEKCDIRVGACTALPNMAGAQSSASSFVIKDALGKSKLITMAGNAPSGLSTQILELAEPATAQRSTPVISTDRGVAGKVDAGDKVSYEVTVSAGDSASVKGIALTGADTTRSGYTATVTKIVDATGTAQPLTSADPAALTLAKGQTATITLTQTATKAQVNAAATIGVGDLSAAASIDGAAAATLTTFTPATLPTAALAMTVDSATYQITTDKAPTAATTQGKASLGDVATLTVKVTNSGATPITLTGTGLNTLTLAAGAQGTLTGTYTITRTDLANGSVKPVPSITAWPSHYATPTEAGENTLAYSTTPTIPTVTPKTSLTIAAAYTDAAGKALPDGPRLAAGTTITATYTLTNGGNLPLTNLTTRIAPTTTPTCAKTTLAPGESTTCTAKLTL